MFFEMDILRLGLKKNRLRIRPTLALSSLFGSIQQSYTANSSKSVRIDNGNLPEHTYLRS